MDVYVYVYALDGTLNIAGVDGVFRGSGGGVFSGGGDGGGDGGVVVIAISVDAVVVVLALLTRIGGVIGRVRRRCSGRSILGNCSGTQN